MDISLPDVSGFEVANRIRKTHSYVRILFLSMHDEPEYVIRSIKSGGEGYILKTAEIEELVNAVRSVARGEKYYSHQVAKIIFSSCDSHHYNPSRSEKTIVLTNREREILRYVADGYNTREIANILYISPRTVETHRLRIMQKLEAHNTAELIKLALMYKLIQF
ncbi:MAG: response regulator transcription factor [Bacteroidia bacterium]|nr:response regulator transcription factor [Bacteroidia bacterium]